MDLLVTGGAGFIGSNFVRYVLSARPDWRLTVLDALTYAGDKKNLDGLPKDRLTFIKGNVLDDDILDKLVKDCEAVVHFAAETHVDNSLTNPADFIGSNIVGTFKLLEAVRRHNKRLHHISTDEVFGDLMLDSKSKFNETTAYNPSSPYSASKAASDHLVRAWIRTYNVQATLSNCSNNYGPFQHVEKFIPRQITEILEGRKPKLYGQGENVRDWIHVDDHSSAVLQILEKGAMGETYMIGANCELSNREVISMILTLMGKKPNDYESVNDRIGHDLRYAIDATKIKEQLGWQAEYSDFRVGLRDTIKWYQENKSWWQPQKQATENKYKELSA